MANEPVEVTVEILEAFADAWNRHDVDDLMSFMTDDCIFESSGGEETCGTRYEGAEAVRRGYSKAWEDFPNAKWNDARHFVKGNRGVSEWIFTGTNNEGKRSEVAGCDIFTFRDGKILVKNSYRKNRPLI
jgi:steroid delta-isomerase-like uncharacterized protein